MGRFTDYLTLAQPRTGRLVAEDGTTVNEADVLLAQQQASESTTGANATRQLEEFSNRSLMGYAFSGTENYTIPAGETADFMIGGNAPYAIQVHSLTLKLGGGDAEISLHHGAGYSVGNTGANLYNDSDAAMPTSQALTARKDGGAVDTTNDLLSTFHEAPTGSAHRVSSSITLADSIITVGAGRSAIVSVENTGTSGLRCVFSALWVEPDGGVTG